MKRFLLILMCLVMTATFAQDSLDESLPYYEIPEYPETFTAGTVAARMIDGLGFRFYWASEGLRPEDYSYKPSDDVRSTGETLDHILNLSQVIVNATLKQPNSKTDMSKMSFSEKREQVLMNLKTAADILRVSDDISQYVIIFGDNTVPFWNQVNGPIADAIWHCGQIASFRRSSGNPINPKVNHFMGTVKD